MKEALILRSTTDFKNYDNILKSIDINLTASSSIINVESVLVYENDHDKPLEAIFEFPLFASASIYHFEMKTKDKKLVAEVKARAEAEEIYDNAIEEGHTAALSYVDSDRTDVFLINLGNIPPKSQIEIKLCFTMMAETRHIERKTGQISRELYFALPQVLNPRYGTSNTVDEPNFGDFYQVQRKYKFSFQADLRMDKDIQEVTSPNLKYKTDVVGDDRRRAKVVLADEFNYKTDIELHIILEEEPKNSSDFALFVEEGDPSKGSFMSKPCVAAIFRPPVLDRVKETRNEFVFVIDRSGSMDGENIKSAKESLLLFLKSLPKDSRVDIIGFGSNFSSLFNQTVELTDENMKKALDYQKSMKADMGGTEMFNALKHAFETPISAPGWQKQIILITDGDINNSSEVKSLVAKNELNGRIFAIGLGEGYSTALVEGLAEAGHGKARFARKPSELKTAVMEILLLAVQPRASDITISWNFSTNQKVNMLQIPSKIRSAYSNDSLVIYGLFDGPLSEVQGNATLRYKIKGEEFKLTEDFNKKSSTIISSDQLPLHRIACKAQINELNTELLSLQDKKTDEDAAKIKELEEKMKIISIDANVICKMTSFICVDPNVQDKGIEKTRVISKPTMYEKEYLQSSCQYSRIRQSGLCSLRLDSSMQQKGVMKKASKTTPLLNLKSLNCTARKHKMREVIQDKISADANFEPEDKLIQIISFQTNKGNWSIGKDLQKCLDEVIRPNTITKVLLGNKNKYSNDEYITLIVLKVFEKYFKDREIEWTMVADNAWSFLENPNKGQIKLDYEGIEV